MKKLLLIGEGNFILFGKSVHTMDAFNMVFDIEDDTAFIVTSVEEFDDLKKLMNKELYKVYSLFSRKEQKVLRKCEVEYFVTNGRLTRITFRRGKKFSPIKVESNVWFNYI